MSEEMPESCRRVGDMRGERPRGERQRGGRLRGSGAGGQRQGQLPSSDAQRCSHADHPSCMLRGRAAQRAQPVRRRTWCHEWLTRRASGTMSISEP